jgi:hypothetical protein
MFSQQARDDFFYSKYPLLKNQNGSNNNLLLRYKVGSKAVVKHFESSSKEVPMRILLDSIRLILTLICLLLTFYASFPDFYGFSLTSIRLLLTSMRLLSIYVFSHFYSSYLTSMRLLSLLCVLLLTSIRSLSLLCVFSSLLCVFY